MSDIILGLSIIGGILVFGVIVCSFIYFLVWLNTYNGYPNHISFNRFLSLQKISPKKWDLRDSVVIYAVSLHDRVCFSFGLKDYIRYQRWKNKCDKQEAKMYAYKEQQKVIEAIKKDIEEFKIQNEKEMKQGLDKISDERYKKLEKFKREQLEIEEGVLIRKKVKIEHL